MSTITMELSSLTPSQVRGETDARLLVNGDDSLLARCYDRSVVFNNVGAWVSLSTHLSVALLDSPLLTNDIKTCCLSFTSVSNAA
jgi:hypothetical protein